MPPNPIVLPIGAGLAVNGYKLTDHNRTAVSISVTRLENRMRMANGMLRTFVIAEKRKFKTSWDMLPSQDARTVDGFWGASSMINFHKSTFNEFTLRLTNGNNTYEDVLVQFADFSSQLKFRSKYTDLYAIDMTFEEV